MVDHRPQRLPAIGMGRVDGFAGDQPVAAFDNGTVELRQRRRPQVEPLDARWRKPFEEMTEADFDRILSVNLRGPFLCSREAIRHFLSRPGGGVILNNSSVHEIIPKPKYLPYSISKGGMENLTKSLALEYAGQGIRVNAVGPGAVVTPINKAWIDNPKARGEVESHIPMGRAAAADEIASVFTFLASDEASYVTGQTIFACGGLTLYPEFRVAWSSGE